MNRLRLVIWDFFAKEKKKKIRVTGIVGIELELHKAQSSREFSSDSIVLDPFMMISWDVRYIRRKRWVETPGK